MSLGTQASATPPPLTPTTAIDRTESYLAFFLPFFLSFFFLSFFLPFFAIGVSFLQDMAMWPIPGQLQWMLSAALFGLDPALQRLFRALALVGVSRWICSSSLVTIRHIRDYTPDRGDVNTGLWAVRF